MGLNLVTNGSMYTNLLMTTDADYDGDDYVILSEATLHAEMTPIARKNTRDVIFRKMTNRNQTDTNEMTTTENQIPNQILFCPKIPIINQILTRLFSNFR